MHARFVCKENEEFRCNGWVLKTKPYFDPAAGMQLAHDFFEEFPSGKDQPHDEFLALGASLFTRGDGGYFIYRPWYEHIAADFDEAFRHCQDEGGYWFKDAPNTLPLREEWAESQIVQVGSEVRRMIRESKSDTYNVSKYKSKIPHALDWLRIGYRRAVKRYKHSDSCTMAHLFKQLETEADKALKYAEPYDELNVFCNPRRGILKVTHVPSYELPEYAY